MKKFTTISLMLSAIATTFIGWKRWTVKRAKQVLYGIEHYDEVRRLERRTARYIVANIGNKNVSPAEFHRTLTEMNRQIEELMK